MSHLKLAQIIEQGEFAVVARGQASVQHMAH